MSNSASGLQLIRALGLPPNLSLISSSGALFHVCFPLYLASDRTMSFFSHVSVPTGYLSHGACEVGDPEICQLPMSHSLPKRERPINIIPCLSNVLPNNSSHYYRRQILDVTLGSLICLFCFNDIDDYV